MKTKGEALIDEDGVITTRTITPFLRTPFNYDTKVVSRETATACEDPTLAQQQFRDECDINVILERFQVTGVVPTNVRQPIAQDFIEATDYQSALNALIEAEESFMQMPAKVRAEFNNDPGQFIRFFEDPKNISRGIELGLAIEQPGGKKAGNEPAGTPSPGGE